MYPRLIQRYGREYARKAIVNPGMNVNERSHAVIGSTTTRTREGYVRKWKACLNDRLKPERDMGGSSFGYDTSTLQESIPGIMVKTECSRSKSLEDLRSKIAQALLLVKEPQLGECYQVGKVLGVGREGVVRPAVSIKQDSNGQLAAVKSLNKMHQFSQVKGDVLKREVKVLEDLKPHPNIVQLVDVYESPINLHIVLTLCEGGDLFTYLHERNFAKQNEKDVARVVLKILCALASCHQQDYAHLDVKLENIMRLKPGPEIDSGEIVLIDFGHANKLPISDSKQQEGRLSRPVGSPSYAAPEVVLEHRFTERSDAWSAGVVLYILLQGYLPFPHLQRKRWRDFSVADYEASENDPFCYEGDWEGISSSAKRLTESLLQIDPAKRLTVRDALQNPWFKEQGFTVQLDANGLPTVGICSNPTPFRAQPFFVTRLLQMI